MSASYTTTRSSRLTEAKWAKVMIDVLVVVRGDDISFVHQADVRGVLLRPPAQALRMARPARKAVQIFQAAPVRDPGRDVGVVFVRGEEGRGSAEDLSSYCQHAIH